MNSSPIPFLTPKDPVVKAPPSQKAYSTKTQYYIPKTRKPISLNQRINTERQTLLSLAKKTHSNFKPDFIPSESRTFQSSLKSKSNHFVIKSKQRTHEGLMGGSIIGGLGRGSTEGPVTGNKNSNTLGNGQNNASLGNSQQKQQCWENNWEDLEMNAYREEVLMGILNSENLREKNISLETLFEENPDYFGHLFGMCACYKCVCGRCKCKYLLENSLACKFHPKNMGSTYSEEFNAKSPDTFIPKTDKIRTFEGALSKNPPMDSVTINQTEYRPFLQHAEKRQRNVSFTTQDSPFMGLTQYQSEFANWRNYDRLIVKRPVQPTVIYDLPFFAKTTYYDSFSNEKGRKHEKMHSMKPQGNE